MLSTNWTLAGNALVQIFHGATMCPFVKVERGEQKEWLTYHYGHLASAHLRIPNCSAGATPFVQGTFGAPL